jgi:hypothetical protein
MPILSSLVVALDLMNISFWKLKCCKKYFFKTAQTALAQSTVFLYSTTHAGEVST